MGHLRRAGRHHTGCRPDSHEPREFGKVLCSGRRGRTAPLPAPRRLLRLSRYWVRRPPPRGVRDFVGVPGMVRIYRHRLTDRLLDIGEKGPLVTVAEGECDAFGTGSRRAADAMDVTLGFVRQVEVDDVADAVDIYAAGGNVGRHQNAYPPCLEVGQRTLQRALR